MTITELKVILLYEERLLALSRAAEQFKDNVKGLKLCRKMVMLEREIIQTSKSLLNESDVAEIIEQYNELISALKTLRSTKNANLYLKASNDLLSVMSRAEKKCKECAEAIAKDSETHEGATLNKIKKYIENIDSKICDGVSKIGEVAKDGAEKIKKILAGDAN